MKIIFDKSFLKSIRKIKDAELKRRLEVVISEVEEAKGLKEIPNIKKMQGFDSFYRIRIGDYRLGIELEAKDQVRFILVSHRRNIYDEFPWLRLHIH